ncbi:MAG TPA: thioredoxin domain-containing protein [Gemmatimonadales bacterium]|nr:thioredoxin domain-containing protein [Gemmatimonadales bacterium]
MNHLASSRSPYLSSAAHQPVHWYPWGPEAFAAARTSGRPILLDIGAVWCHWCHVMDGESYEDPSLAELLNAEFVCVKVDRDERPDVDARYQRAVQALTGQGGWPLTAFLSAAGEVFYGGTYFPPEGHHGRPGFRTVLTEVARIHREEKDRVAAQALAIRRTLAHPQDGPEPVDPTVALLEQAEAELARHYDPRHGGFGRSPKFPHPAAVCFLIDRWCDSGQAAPREMAAGTLRGMARGGFHDQLGGGFHRYSVDAEWIVPHFEKMAYDNAELLKAYLDGHSAFGDPYFAEVALDTLRWIREVLADPDGGFGASQDADVGLEDDGNYFTWTADEARAVLSVEEFEVAAAHYDIGTAGEMHHDPARNVLWVAEEVGAIAHRTGRSAAETANLLALAQEKLKAARRLRPAPFVDRTRYTGWNAMLAGALLRAGAHLNDRWATRHALATLDRIRRECARDAAVLHVAGGIGGLLDDQVQVAAAALDAFEAIGDPAWLTWAERLMEQAWTDHRDDHAGGLFDVARTRGGEGLLPERTKPVQDSPTPSPNGVAALNCARLGALLDSGTWRERHLELVQVFGGQAAELGLFGATFLRALEWAVLPVTHLVVVGAVGDAEADRMHRTALTTCIPRKVVHRLTGADAGRPLPAALRAMVDGQAPRAYACRGETCDAPAAEDAAWTATLARLAKPR